VAPHVVYNRLLQTWRPDGAIHVAPKGAGVPCRPVVLQTWRPNGAIHVAPKGAGVPCRPVVLQTWRPDGAIHVAPTELFRHLQ
jgi:hypothetical protein